MFEPSIWPGSWVWFEIRFHILYLEEMCRSMTKIRTRTQLSSYAAARTLIHGRRYEDAATRTKLQHATSKMQLEASSIFHIHHLPLSLSPNFSSSHFALLCFVQNLARQGRIHGHKWLSLRRQKSKSKTKASHTDGRTQPLIELLRRH